MRTYTHSPTLRIGYMLALKKWNIAYMRYVTYMYVPRFLLRPALCEVDTYKFYPSLTLSNSEHVSGA